MRKQESEGKKKHAGRIQQLHSSGLVSKVVVSGRQ